MCSARNPRFNPTFIPIQAGGGGGPFLSPTINYTENPLSDEIQKTDGARNLNMDVEYNMHPHHGPQYVLGADNSAGDAAGDVPGDTVGDVADDGGPSSSSSTSPGQDDNAEDGADVEMEEEGREEQEEAHGSSD
ncbi:hypothetical protein BGZ47_004840 [Haplosporangium gracile]|nr:hypothetical protein BGZ47_004840 [Haplosporangium gracile]